MPANIYEDRMTSPQGADAPNQDEKEFAATDPEMGSGIRDLAERQSETTLDPGKEENSPKEKTSEQPRDPNLVTWDGPSDPENPKNWTKRRRWAATFVSPPYSYFCDGSANAMVHARSSLLLPLFHQYPRRLLHLQSNR